MLDIEPVRQAPRVVEEPEAEDERAVDLRSARGQREARSGNATPVVVAVDRGVAAPRTGQRPVDERRQRPRFHPVTIARCAAVWGDAAHASGTPRRRRVIVRTGSPPSTPWRTSQHPTTVPVRPIPPQQWTYTERSSSRAASTSSR